MPPGNPAHIIANMRITHRTFVAAALQKSCGISSNAAHICPTSNLFPQVQRVLTLGGSLGGGIDVSLIGTLNHTTQILSGNSAHMEVSFHKARKRTVNQPPLRLVDAGNPAHTALTLDSPLKCAAQKLPTVAAYDTSGSVPKICGRDCSPHTQVLDDTAHLHIAEQALHIAVACNQQAGNRMPLAIKGSAKGWNGSEVRSSQINVPGQEDRLSLRPAVQGAIFRKLCQILCCFNRYGILCRPRRWSRCKQQQNSGQRQCHPSMYAFHALPPWNVPRLPSPPLQRPLRG